MDCGIILWQCVKKREKRMRIGLGHSLSFRAAVRIQYIAGPSFSLLEAASRIYRAVNPFEGKDT